VLWERIVKREPVCVWPLRAELGEGPIWRAEDQAVWFVDIKSDTLHRFHPETGGQAAWAAPSRPGFIAPLRGGGFVVGAKAGLHRFDAETGSFELLRTVEPEAPENRLNDACVDQAGGLWFGSMHDPETEDSGALYVYRPGDRLELKARGIRVTNGPAFSPDHRTFYHTDTVHRTVYAYDVDGDGTLTNERIHIRFSADDGYPDGTVVDAEGGLWIGSFGGGALLRFSSEGRLAERIAFPCANVTKAAFGGADLKTLFVTTARVGCDAETLSGQPLAGGLFTLSSDVPGLPQRDVRL
jgi:D-xylonolactonase